ncbi:MAG: nucleotidyltransferase domain-containing protein [Methanobrevibacter sp.]|nr:nucleotidyltransferase domain-containing protein [Methanobrevibacter sp.]MBO7692565.1 nucleotidyltransferase domain-containing protein [Methanobrevibacter sp.]
MNNLTNVIKERLTKIGKDFNEKEYGFLNTDERLRTPVLITLGGSHAYGTNIETSDMDIRGISMNSADNILLGKDFEQVANEPTDTTIYSFDKMTSLLTNCNPNTIEILGVKPEHILYKSDIGEELIKNKDMFLSLRAVKSFGGYANAQLYRLQQKSLVALTPEQLNAHIVKTLNGMRDMLEMKHDMKGIQVHLKDGEIVVDINVNDYPAESIAGVLNVFNKTLNDYHKNSVRNEKAMNHGKISKHAMHLLRLYMMCEDILLKGEINTYREKEHDLLMDIRNGKYLGEDGRPNKEFFDIVKEYEVKVEYAKKHTYLPMEPDIEKINNFRKRMNLRMVEQITKRR